MEADFRVKACLVRFEVLTAVTVKIAVFWNVTHCSLVSYYQRFGGTCCLHVLVKDVRQNVGTSLTGYSASQPRDTNLHNVSYSLTGKYRIFPNLKKLEINLRN
jgi:hypothetical protein